MKVESTPDVQTLQSLDQPVVSGTTRAQVPVAAPVVDDLANLFSQEVAFNSKALGQRSMGVRITPVEQLSQLYDQLGHPAQASLAAISRRVRLQLLQQPGVDKLLEITGNDPARTYVILRQVTAQAEAEVRKTEAALARDALAKLEVRYRREIQAGLNIAMALQAATDDPQERQAMRALYYASVVVRQSLATMMQALLGVYGGEQFAAGLNVMRRALADDIAAQASSIPGAKLRTLLLGLQSCGHLSGVLSSCESLIRNRVRPCRCLASNGVSVAAQRLTWCFMTRGLRAATCCCAGEQSGGACRPRKGWCKTTRGSCWRRLPTWLRTCHLLSVVLGSVCPLPINHGRLSLNPYGWRRCKRRRRSCRCGREQESPRQVAVQPATARSRLIRVRLDSTRVILVASRQV